MKSHATPWVVLFVCSGLFCASALGGDPNPDYKLTLGDGVAPEIGDSTTITLTLDSGSGEEILGYSFGVCNDSLVDSDAGDVVNGSALSGHSFTFHSILHYTNGWTVGCVLETGDVSDTIAPADNQELYLVSYEALGEGLSKIEICELGSPTVKPSVVVEDPDDPGALVEYLPVLNDGTIVIGGEPPFILEAGTVVGSQGNQVVVPVTLSAPREAEAFTFGLSYDSQFLTLDEIAEGSALDELNSGTGPAYFQANLDPAGSFSGATVACVVSLSAPLDKIAEGDDQEIALFTFTAAPDAEDQSLSTLDFTGSLGSPPVRVVVSVNGASEVPVRRSGEVLIKGNPIPVFVRGDPNADGRVNISDPLYLALYLFKNGATPNCLPSADANHDDKVTLGDATFLLTYLFQSGAAPSSPFPKCDSDPDPDSGLDCASSHKDSCP